MTMKKIMFLLLISAGFCKAQTSYEINGVFVVDQTYYVDSLESTEVNNGVAAYFCHPPTSSPDFQNLTGAGKVAFNNGDLTKDPTVGAYSGVGISSFSEKKWDVEGSTYIPQMSFSYDGELPGFNFNAMQLADTIHRDDTLFIDIPDIHEADSICIRVIENPEDASTYRVEMIAPNYTNRYYIVPEALANLGLSVHGALKIEAVNYSYQTVEGKLFLFRNIYSYIKHNIVIAN